MQELEVQQLLLDIIAYAQKGKFTEFHFITSWSEFKFYRQSVRSTKIVIRVLKTSAKNLFKKYCKDIASAKPDVNELYAYIQLCNMVDFYQKDLNILKRMVDEYDNYLGKGHFWYSFLGGERQL